MTRLVFHIERNSIPRISAENEIHVWLYGSSPPFDGVGSVGSQAMDVASRFNVRPSVAAIDFLSIAMAVTAADTFVLRDEASDAWSRSFEIVLPLAEPTRWNALRQRLEAILLFLSGDQWSFVFRPGGARPPIPSAIRRRYNVFDLSKIDCVSLFSGGLDSGIGALDLLAQGRHPLLVSHSARGDAEHQLSVARLLPSMCQRVSVNTYPTWSGADDDSMRTRSFQFLALGALAAQALASFRGPQFGELLVCENGLIALNPPLTPRRVGSHSTRTAHPYFLEGIQSLWDAAGVPVTIRNPYEQMTKGEMFATHVATPRFDHFAAATVSCGKWKRKNQQCGRCVPCLIRRSSFDAARIQDPTSYQSPDLTLVMSDEDKRDDLISVQSAIVRTRGKDIRPWVLQAGPLPSHVGRRMGYFEVVRRGLDEIAAFLRHQGFQL